MNIKQAIITRGVENYTLSPELNLSHQPKAGDVAVFRVKEIGKHSRIQCVEGKNRDIYSGDLVLMAFGNRYATNQIEGYVPTMPLEEYHILGQGGVVGEMKSIHHRFTLGATTLELIGYAVNEKNEVINTKYHNYEKTKFTGMKPKNIPVILSVGGSMDSGKTTTAGYICRGIQQAGKRACFFKLTGTVYTKDIDFVKDCGAVHAADFSTFGFPSTFMCETEDLMDLYQNLINDVTAQNPDYIVIEIADGLLQRETKALLQNEKFMQTIDHVIYSDGSSTGIIHGLELLRKWGIEPFALAGCFTSAPLLIQEVEAIENKQVLTLMDLASPNIEQQFWYGATIHRAPNQNNLKAVAVA